MTAAAVTGCKTGDGGARRLLKDLFDTAVPSADPAKVLAFHLPEPPRGCRVVVGAGKSAAVMAPAVEAAWADVDLCASSSRATAMPSRRGGSRSSRRRIRFPMRPAS